VRDSDVSAERLDGDVIAVNLATGAYFSLSGPAADVWTAATSGASGQTWFDSLKLAYATPIPTVDVETFLLACLEHGLIEVTTPWNAEPPNLPEDHLRTQWQKPHLDVFTDLQDLLLLDPIHDASDLGWPQTVNIDD